MPRFLLPVLRSLVTCWVAGMAFGGCERSKGTGESSSAEQVAAGSPTIHFDARSHNFGTVNEGTMLKHVFTVRNTGTSLLVLRRVSASCGCTAVAVNTEEIPPGGSGAIEITYATRGFPGENHTSITVDSNDPKSPTTILEFGANVERLLDFEPPFPRIGTRQGVDETLRVWLIGKLAEQARLAVTATDCARDVAAKVIQQRHGKRNKMGLELKLNAGRASSGECSFTLSTGLPNPPELNLQLGYSVEGRKSNG